jgi:hypothetical protein
MRRVEEFLSFSDLVPGLRFTECFYGFSRDEILCVLCVCSLMTVTQRGLPSQYRFVSCNYWLGIAALLSTIAIVASNLTT